MTKPNEFETKKELPNIVKETLYDIATAYVDVLDYTMKHMTDDDPSMEEVQDLEIMIHDELANALDVALFNSTFKN